MEFNNVIDFLKKAQNKTYSSQDKFFLENAIDTLYHMKECGCFNL